MSVFRGGIIEYPGIIVDHFIPFNCERGRAFFLSHCHKDHMTGLNSPAISYALQRHKTNLYCSDVTQSLLLKDPEFSHLSPYLKGLPMELPVAMTLDTPSDLPPLSFTVTLLPAGHCPGSAMFLFQGSKGNVLYTGDFRLTLEETQRLQPLHINGSLISISSLYLDTTFCHPCASQIPSRAVSRDHVLKIMEMWLSSDPCNVVKLHCPAFGYEHIFMGVAERLKTKVHIANWKFNAYADLPAVTECLTTDRNSTRVHNCAYRRGVARTGGLPCGGVPVDGVPRILHIKPSTLWFLSTLHSLTEPSVYLPRYHSYRVLHSMHASYTEICQFVSYLQPKRIIPCVVPLGDTTLTDVHSRLKSLLPQSQVLSDVIISSSNSNTDSTSSRAGHDLDEEDDVEDGGHLEQSQVVPFSSSCPLTSDGVVVVSLPSMRTSQGCSGGVIAAPSSSSSERPGSDGSDPVVDSLEQTPLDISLDLSGGESCHGNDSAELSAAASTEIVGTATAAAAEIVSEVATRILPSQPLKSKLKHHLRSGKSSKKKKKRSHLKDGVPRTKSNKAAIPPRKRSKVAGVTGNNSTGAKLLSPCQMFEVMPVDYIDLTLEDKVISDTTLNKDHQPHPTLNKDHQLQPTLNNDHHFNNKGCNPINPIFISDSCEEQNENSAELKESSPDILPPTPGREQVESILQRKKLTVL